MNNQIEHAIATNEYRLNLTDDGLKLERKYQSYKNNYVTPDGCIRLGEYSRSYWEQVETIDTRSVK